MTLTILAALRKRIVEASVWSRARFLTMISFITLLGGRVWTGTTCYVGMGAVGVACPLGVAQISAATGIFNPTLAMAALIGALLSIILGRAFCSWICPGHWLFNHAPTTAARPLPARPLIQSVIVGSVVGAAWLFHIPLFCFICPAGVVCRGIVAAGIGGSVLPTVGWLSAVTGTEWASGRSWCRDLCPLGALLSRLGSLNPFLKVRSDPERCRPCLACQKACAEGLNLGRDTDFSTCTKCFACVSACPREAVEIKLW